MALTVRNAPIESPSQYRTIDVPCKGCGANWGQICANNVFYGLFDIWRHSVRRISTFCVQIGPKWSKALIVNAKRVDSKVTHYPGGSLPGWLITRVLDLVVEESNVNDHSSGRTTPPAIFTLPTCRFQPSTTTPIVAILTYPFDWAEIDLRWVIYSVIYTI